MIHQGKILQQECKRARYPVIKLAGKLGLTRTYMYSLFRKEYISSEIIEKVCPILNISPGIFFSVKGSETITVLIISGKINPLKKIVIDPERVLNHYQVK